MINWLHRIRQWGEFALIITVAIIVIIFFTKPSLFNPILRPIINPPNVNVKVDSKEYIKKVEELEKKIDKLEELLSKKQQQGEANIDRSLQEKDIRKSIDTMQENWK